MEVTLCHPDGAQTKRLEIHDAADYAWKQWGNDAFAVAICGQRSAFDAYWIELERLAESTVDA